MDDFWSDMQWAAENNDPSYSVLDEGTSNTPLDDPTYYQSLLDNIDTSSPEFQDTLNEYYPQETPQGTSEAQLEEWLSTLPAYEPEPSYSDMYSSGIYGSALPEGAVTNPLFDLSRADSPYITTDTGDTYIRNKEGQVVGFLSKDGDIKYYDELEGYRENFRQAASKLGGVSVNAKGGKSDSSDEDYQKILKNLLAKQAIDQMKAKQAYANSGVGKALSGLGMAGMLYQALKGKNNAPKVEARGNQGVSFSPAYQGSSAPKTKYASGGEVLGGLPRMALEQALRKTGRVQGQGGGQDDVVDIKAAPGEYVFDAEAVSALGDGNTEEGARKLDEMRMNIRKHKRTGGLSAIPPKAKKPEQYMKKGK